MVKVEAPTALFIMPTAYQSRCHRLVLCHDLGETIMWLKIVFSSVLAYGLLLNIANNSSIAVSDIR